MSAFGRSRRIRSDRARRRPIRRLLTAALLGVAVTVAPVVIASPHAIAAVPGPTGPAPSLNAAFQRSPASFLAALTCPVGRTVQHVTSTIPGVNTLTNDLANILCALRVLGYAYRTIYIPTSGPPVVRYYSAIMGVPTLLDVNGDGIADFSSSVSPTLAVPGLQLSINRGGFPSSAKVSVEAFFLDPTSGSTFVGIGEDGTEHGTGTSYIVSVGAFLSSFPAIDAQLQIKSSAAQVVGGGVTSLNTLCDVLFGTNPDVPNSMYNGKLGFSPVPNTFTTRLRIGSNSQRATVTTTVRTKLSAHVAIVNPGDEKDVDALIDQLATSTDVFHQTLSNGHETTTYTAANVVNHVNGSYHDIDTAHNNAVKVAAALDVTSMPSALTVDQFDSKTSLSVPTGVVGAVEARFATGQDLPASPAGTAPYVAFHRYTSSRLAAGLRLANIKSASFDAAGPYVGDITFLPAPGYIPLSFVDDVTHITATGHLSNLPAHLTVTVDLANGLVVFDGHGQGIHEIAVSATKPTPFFAKATRLGLTIDDLPATDTVNFKQTTGTVSFTPSAPIGSVSLLASDGTPAPPVTGDYASYEDTPTLWRAYLQVVQIAGVTFTASPLSGTIKAGSQQKMTLFAHLKDATHDMQANGLIDSLPTQIDFSLVNNADGSATVDYNSHGQAITQITLTATGLPLPFNADSAYIEIDHLPSHMTGTIPAAGGDAIFDPHGDHIGRVLVQVYPHAAGAIPSVSGHQTAYADLGKGQFTADIQNIGYTKIHTGSDKIYAQYDISSAPFDVTFRNDDDTKSFVANISNPEPATIQSIDGDGLKLDYKVDSASANFTGDGSINSIGITSTLTGNYMSVTLQHIAPHLVICVDGASMLCVPSWVDGHVSLDPSNVNNIPPSFGFQLLPLNLADDNPYPVRMRVDGAVCLNSSDPSCADPANGKQVITIDDLQFGTIEAGFGNRTHDCTIFCGNLFGYFNTNGTPISGTLAYYAADSSLGSPFIKYSAINPDDNNPTVGLEATDFYDHFHYAVPDFDNHPTGDFHCDGSPHLNVDFGSHADIDFNFDFLSGTFGIC